jgi:hypothetical protein
MADNEWWKKELSLAMVKNRAMYTFREMGV